MTNYEKYQKDIIEIIKSGITIAIKDGMPVECSSVSCLNCDFYKETHCRKKVGEWLESEYVEPTVDWSKVPVDTKVLVSSDGEVWKKRHFARVEHGWPLVWGDGQTSWSTDRAEYSRHWKFIKLYDEMPSKDENDIRK